MGELPGSAYKAYIEVAVKFKPDGTMEPTAIVWEDGISYEVNRVISVRSGYAAKAGGQGDRYVVQVNGHQTCIYFERSTNITGKVIGRWFAERKVPVLPENDEFEEIP